MTLMDILARNIIHFVNPEVFVISSYAAMLPYDIGGMFADSVYYMIGSTMFPIALGLSLPLFMHTMVLERQNRLKGIMCMHGLLETHYWIVNLGTGILLYLAIYCTFFFMGSVVFDMNIFTQTSPTIFVAW